MSTTCGILHDYQGMVLAACSSFVSHQAILYAELMAVCEGLELVAQLGYSVLEVEFDSAIAVSWIQSSAFVCWFYAYTLVGSIF